MQNVLVVDNHSFREDLLTKGFVLDAGARGFVFSKWFAERGHKVYALDPSPDIESVPDGITHVSKALVSKAGYMPMMSLEMGSDPNAWHVKCDGTFDSFPVHCVTLQGLVEGSLGPSCWFQWDLIKLNIEGSEYGILDEIDGPISRQIVFSFHEHTDRARGREECDRIINKLRQWYDISNQVWEKRYGCRENYWDVLAIQKGLA